MTTQSANVPSQAPKRPVFYLAMAAIFAIIAISGFTPGNLLPVATHRFDGSPLVHIHAILFFGWMVLFAWQSGLVRHRRIEAHRAWGMAGISLATGMVFTAIALVVQGLDAADAAGNFDRLRLPAIAPLSQIALFAVFVAAAVASVRRPETHRRLMLLATANLLPPAIARLFGVVLAPPNAGRPEFALSPMRIAHLRSRWRPRSSSIFSSSWRSLTTGARGAGRTAPTSSAAAACCSCTCCANRSRTQICGAGSPMHGSRWRDDTSLISAKSLTGRSPGVIVS